ncbi:MAG: Uncharacterized protein HW421_405 [Ignavibacteria bacterium]|nr:Uncharacterized protein [Ignavibacteria bacterium]
MHEKRQNLHLIVLTVIAVIFLIAGLHRITYLYFIPFFEGSRPFSQDFKIFYYSAKTFFEAPLNIYNAPISGIPVPYLYPPPSIFLFVPFSLLPEVSSYFSFVLIGILAYIISIRLLIKSIEINIDIKFVRFQRICIWLIAFGFGPFIQNLRQGQVTSFVLLACVGTYYLLIRGKNTSAAGILLIGFWIKLYPIILFPLLLKEKKYIQVAIGTGLGILLPMIITIFFSPFEIFSVYFTRIVPSTSQQIMLNPLNQSIAGFLMRVSAGATSFTSWNYFFVPVGIKVTVIIISLISLSWIFHYFFKKSANSLFVFISLTSITSMISFLGWEYSYLLALPLVIYSIGILPNINPSQKLIVFICILALIIPKPPDEFTPQIIEIMPLFIANILYSRYIFAVIGINIICYIFISKQNKILR